MKCINIKYMDIYLITFDYEIDVAMSSLLGDVQARSDVLLYTHVNLRLPLLLTLMHISKAHFCYFSHFYISNWC